MARKKSGHHTTALGLLAGTGLTSMLGGDSTPDPNEAYGSENLADANSTNPLYLDSQGNDVSSAAQKYGTKNRYVEPTAGQRMFRPALAQQIDTLNTKYIDQPLAAQQQEQTTQDILRPKVRAVMEHAAKVSGGDPSKISNEDVDAMVLQHGAEASNNALSTGVLNTERLNQTLSKLGTPEREASLQDYTTRTAHEKAAKDYYAGLGGAQSDEALAQARYGSALAGGRLNILPLTLGAEASQAAYGSALNDARLPYAGNAASAENAANILSTAQSNAELPNVSRKALASGLIADYTGTNTKDEIANLPLSNAARQAEAQRAIVNARTINPGPDNPNMRMINENGTISSAPNLYYSPSMLNKMGTMQQFGQQYGGQNTQGGTAILPNGSAVVGLPRKAQTIPALSVLPISSATSTNASAPPITQFASQPSNYGLTTPYPTVTPSSSPAVTPTLSSPPTATSPGYYSPQTTLPTSSMGPTSLTTGQSALPQGMQQAIQSNQAIRDDRIKSLLDRQKKYPIYMKYNGEAEELQNLLQQQHLQQIMDNSQ